MEAVIAKLEEQETDEEVITSYKEQMTPAQRLQLESFTKTVNKYVMLSLLCASSSMLRCMQWNIVFDTFDSQVVL